MSRMGHIEEAKNRLTVGMGRRWGGIDDGFEVSFCADENVTELKIAMAGWHSCLEGHPVHQKWQV